MGLTISGYALWLVSQSSIAPWFVIWFVAGAVGHDFILYPIYSLLLRFSPARSRYFVAGRVAIGISLLLALVDAPLVLRLGQRSYSKITTLSPDPYLWHWLAVSLAVGAGSLAAAYFSNRKSGAGRKPASPEKTVNQDGVSVPSAVPGNPEDHIAAGQGDQDDKAQLQGDE